MDITAKEILEARKNKTCFHTQEMANAIYAIRHFNYANHAANAKQRKRFIEMAKEGLRNEAIPF